MFRFDAFLFLCLLASTFASPPSVTKVYRSDYVYNDRTSAFYKLHIESVSRTDAGRKCEMEGAALMLPRTHLDVSQLHAMMKRFPDIGDYVWVAEDDEQHESAEEPVIIDLTPHEQEDPGAIELCNVVNRKGDIETIACFRSLPFICKVTSLEAPYNRDCDVYGKDYRVYRNVSSCYKIPKLPYSWNAAYAECKAEGAHLVVINSEAEHDAVHELMNAEPKVVGSKAWWFYYAGYRAEVPTDGKPKVFKTIFNETLEQAGYSSWAPNEPNNALSNEDCGTLFRNDGKLNDVYCNHLYGFICEKEIQVEN